MKNSKSFVGWTLLGLGALLAGHQAACQIFVDSTKAQCSSDAECRNRGPAFADTFCSEAHICSRSVDYCSKNTDCIDRLGNEASICRADHTCVSLLTKNCKLLADKDDLRNNEAVVIGVHGIPSWAPLTQGCESGTELARRDFKSAQGGLPPSPTSNGASRPVVFVACDVPIGKQPENKDVSDHLFEAVRSPVVMGAYANTDFTTYALRKSIATNTALVTVASDDPLFDLPGRQGLFYSWGLPLGAPPFAYAKGVEAYEPIVRAKKGNITRDLKVAYAYTNVAAESSIASAIHDLIKFNNGKSATQNGANYQEFQHTTQATDPNYQASLSDTSLKIRDFAPDILVARGNAVELGLLVERLLPDTIYYLMDDSERQNVPSWVLTNESLRKRIIGGRPGRYEKDPRIERFNQRFATAAPPLEGATGSLARVCFDQTYATMFAMAAINNEPLTGKAIGKVFQDKFKTTGTKLDATPASILKGFAAVQAGQDIYLQGNEGDVLFNPKDGFVPDWSIQFWCVDKNVNAKERIFDAGIFYSAFTNLITTTTGDDVLTQVTKVCEW